MFRGCDGMAPAHLMIIGPATRRIPGGLRALPHGPVQMRPPPRRPVPLLDAFILRAGTPEEPVPASGELGELVRAGERVIPGIEDLTDCHRGEASLGEAMLDFERLPELLVQALEAEPCEQEVVAAALGLDGGEPFGLLRGQAALEGP